MENSEKLLSLLAEAEEKLKDIFADIDKVSFENTKK